MHYEVCFIVLPVCSVVTAVKECAKNVVYELVVT